MTNGCPGHSRLDPRRNPNQPQLYSMSMTIGKEICGTNSCGYFGQKAGPKAVIRTRNEGDEKFSIDELNFRCAIRIRILEHTQDNDRRNSISRWDWKLGTAAHIGEEARDMGTNSAGGSEQETREIGDWLNPRRGRTDSPRAASGDSYSIGQAIFLEQDFGGHHSARRTQPVQEHKEVGRMNISKEGSSRETMTKAQEIRILLETAHPVRGHKEAGPMNCSPRANATKARTLGGILLDAARVQASKFSGPAPTSCDEIRKGGRGKKRGSFKSKVIAARGQADRMGWHYAGTSRRILDLNRPALSVHAEPQRQQREPVACRALRRIGERPACLTYFSPFLARMSSCFEVGHMRVVDASRRLPSTLFVLPPPSPQY
ncbi:hypothetical protein B0H13DRAFT_2403517 [Mycena leptocephala]|nr:hypothetical protein B0H13DRAFT_2403517 [Mycena leptocephala]